MERRAVLLLLSTLMLPALAVAAERATAGEAQELVKRAIEHFRKNGRAGLKELAREEGAFTDRELYVTVYELDGTCVAHINPRLMGMNTREIRDMDGKYYIRERLDAARAEASGWQEYKSFNRVTRKVEAKRLYWERHQDLVFGAGAYRRVL